MLTPRENLLKALRHDQPEWIPVTGHVDPYNQPHRRGMDPRLAKAMGTVGWGDGSTLAFSRYLALDVADFMGSPLTSRWRRISWETVTQGDDTITLCKTPKGEMRQVSRRVREDGTSYFVEHFVKGAEDLPRLVSMFEDEEIGLDPAGVEAVRARKRQIGDEGILRTYMPSTPLGMMIRAYAGVEATAFLWADCRTELKTLFAVMEENYRQKYGLTASLDFDALFCTDDTSTTTISPTMFEEFCVGFTDRIAAAVHEYGKLYVHHSCGLIRDLLPLYRQTAMDVVDAVTTKPIGNVTISQTKAGLDPEISFIAGLGQLCGNMDNRREVEEDLARMFEEAAPGDGTVFCLAAYPNRDMEQTSFVREVCKKHQRMYAGR